MKNSDVKASIQLSELNMLLVTSCKRLLVVKDLMLTGTCQAAGSRHPLVNIVTLGSVGVRAVEHGAGQGGAVVLGHGGHTGSNWGRRVTRLLRQRRVDAVRHRQRRAHAA